MPETSCWNFRFRFQEMNFTFRSHHRQIDQAVAVEIGSGHALHPRKGSQVLARPESPIPLI